LIIIFYFLILNFEFILIFMQRQQALIALIFVLMIGAITILVRPMLQNQTPLALGLDLRGGSQLTVELQTTPQVPQITPEKLDGVRNVIEKRVNGLGVSESVVQKVGEKRVLVQLPGVSDPAQAEKVLGGTAQLDFRKETANQEIKTEFEVRQKELQELFQSLLQQQSNEKADPNAIADINQKIQDKQQILNNLSAQLYETTGLTGKNLTKAGYQPTQNNSQFWEVTLKFNSEGANQFAALTKDIAGTGRRMGIFLDNQLISAPTVGPEFAATGITGGNVVITGSFTIETARELALQLEGGALPVPVKIVENRTVGATLGQDSIKASIYAGLAGLILVLVFMGVYYRLPGVIADLSLIIYTLLTLACYSIFSITLTLPGIAGFILSIGMAVDANVLIFERTREELRAGKTLYRSVESGFYRAFSSILDSNVTTLIACAALFYLGSGLVKGFALTLALGIVISMFTALTCSRTFLLWVVLSMPGVRQKPELFCPNLSSTINSNQ
jgi:preprotein translocase subunit SecD